MPNYNLVVTAGYRPFTFDEMAKPLMMYKQEYDKYQEDINSMQSNADLAKYYIDEKLDADMLAKHEEYMNALKDLSDAFYNSAGLTAETATRAKNLRRRFSSEIGPMLKAAQERDTEIKEQRQAMLNNPDIVFSRYAQSTPLSYYQSAVRDPYSSINLKALQEKARLGAESITKAYPTTVKLDYAYDENGYTVPGYVTKRTRRGPKDDAQTILREIGNWDGKSEYTGNYSGYASLRKALQNATKLDSYSDSDIIDRINAAIDIGLAEGMTPSVTEEVVQGIKGGSGSSNSSTESIDSFGKRRMQSTETIPQGIATDKDAQKIAKKFSGLYQIPEQAKPEMLSVLGKEPQEGLLNYSTPELDLIYRDAKKYHDETEEKLEEYIQQGASARNSMSDKAKEILERYEKAKELMSNTATREDGEALLNEMRKNREIADWGNPNLGNKKDNELYHRLSVYEGRIRQIKEYRNRKAQKFWDTLADMQNSPKMELYQREDGSYDWESYAQDIENNQSRMLAVEKIDIDENMLKDFVSGIHATNESSKDDTSGLIPLDGGKKLGGQKAVDALYDGQSLKKGVSFGIMNTRMGGKDTYELTVKIGDRRYAVRGLGAKDFSATAGNTINFLKSTVFQSEAGEHKYIKPEGGQTFTGLASLLTRAMYANQDLRDYVSIPDTEIDDNPYAQRISRVGSTPTYGFKLRDSIGNTFNIVTDENYRIIYVADPRTADRSKLMKEMAAGFASTWKLRAKNNVGGLTKETTPDIILD